MHPIAMPWADICSSDARKSWCTLLRMSKLCVPLTYTHNDDTDAIAMNIK